jgi:parallel beta-helix repeat protein
MSGIRLEISSDSNKIEGNDASHNGNGIFIHNSISNKIELNYANDNNGDGISLLSSSSCTISDNSAIGNKYASASNHLAATPSTSTNSTTPIMPGRTAPTI